MTIVLALVGVILMLLAVFGGTLVRRLLPERLLKVGDQVEIFTDGVFNRTATITGLTGDRLFIYGTLPLPLDYRGKFYGVGTDADGVDFWYLADRRHYCLVPFAEGVRRRYRQLSYPFNLCPVTTGDELLTAAKRQMEESDRMEDEDASRDIDEEEDGICGQRSR